MVPPTHLVITSSIVVRMNHFKKNSFCGSSIVVLLFLVHLMRDSLKLYMYNYYIQHGL